VLADSSYRIQEAAVAAGFRALLGVPMLRDGRAIGAITVGRAEPGTFSDPQVQLLSTFAEQATIAIENVRLFKELEARNRDLTETLEQQTATGEILRVISSSPTDIQPVFDIIAESAVRLCRAEVSAVSRLDGEWVHLDAIFGSNPDGVVALRRAFPMRPGPSGGAARVIHERAIVHIPDVLADPGYRIRDAAMAAGFRDGDRVVSIEGQAISTWSQTSVTITRTAKRSVTTVTRPPRPLSAAASRGIDPPPGRTSW